MKQIDLVIEKAERNRPGWSEDAYNAFCKAARKVGTGTVEQIRAKAKIDQPHDLRAWGAITRRAKKNGIIRRCGYDKAVSSHGSPKPLWRAIL